MVISVAKITHLKPVKAKVNFRKVLSQAELDLDFSPRCAVYYKIGRAETVICLHQKYHTSHILTLFPFQLGMCLCVGLSFSPGKYHRMEGTDT